MADPVMWIAYNVIVFGYMVNNYKGCFAHIFTVDTDLRQHDVQSSKGSVKLINLILPLLQNSVMPAQAGIHDKIRAQHSKNFLNNKGFTLLEVIIAISISAVALIGIAGIIGESHNKTGYLEKKVAADLSAQNLMDRHRYTFQSGRKYPIKNESSTIEMGGIEFTYTQKVTEATLPGLKKVDITIYDTDNEHVLRKLSMFASEQ